MPTIDRTSTWLALVVSVLPSALAACSESPGSRTVPPSVTVVVTPATATVPLGGTITFTATVTGSPDVAVIWSVQEPGCGSVAQDGVYTPPTALPAGACHVLATSHADGSKSAVAVVTVTASCWQLLAVNRVRFQPRAGQATAMVGGTFQGSNDSPTNGFTVLATISSQPPEGQWTELAFANTTPYRYVKYYGPPGSYGQIAETEFYSGSTRLTGEGFGTAGSRSGNAWQNALDGDPATFFDGPVANDVYVGIDAASGRVVAPPAFLPPAGSYSASLRVTISSSTPGAAIRYTADGSDPAVGGMAYSGPITVGSGSTTLRAVAASPCMLTSAATLALYTVGGGSSASSSLHIGNSLTDSIEGYLQPVAASGGITLDYWRFTVPGAGTYVYANYPTAGFGGIDNIQTEVHTKPYDHISMQPASNMPCLPTGHANEPDAVNRSDGVNVDEVWNAAVGPNPDVQVWIYSTWPPPTDYATCMTGPPGWVRDAAIWNPPGPTSWEDATSHVTQFNEAVRAYLVSQHPTRPPPYILPAGAGLVNLKRAIEAGSVTGVGTSGFWTFAFARGYGTDDHLTNEGRYFVTLIFYSAMFQRSPAGLPHGNTNLSDAQAAALQDVAWQTVNGYPLSGMGR
jgi:hypothetical protein